MKVFENPRDFGPLINFRERPVVFIDVANRDDYGLVGAPVVIYGGLFPSGNPHYIHACFREFDDRHELVFQSYGACLSSEFTYSDMDEMQTYANAPVIYPGKPFLVVLYDSVNYRFAAPFEVETDGRVSPHCTTPLMLTEKIDWRTVPFVRSLRKE